MDNYFRYARHLEPAVVTGKLLILGGEEGSHRKGRHDLRLGGPNHRRERPKDQSQGHRRGHQRPYLLRGQSHPGGGGRLRGAGYSGQRRGVTASYFGWVQNRASYNWPKEELDARLERVMAGAFDSVLEASRVYGTIMRLAAYCLGIRRVADVLELRGIR